MQKEFRARLAEALRWIDAHREKSKRSGQFVPESLEFNRRRRFAIAAEHGCHFADKRQP